MLIKNIIQKSQTGKNVFWKKKFLIMKLLTLKSELKQCTQ